MATWKWPHYWQLLNIVNSFSFLKPLKWLAFITFFVPDLLLKLIHFYQMHIRREFFPLHLNFITLSTPFTLQTVYSSHRHLLCGICSDRNREESQAQNRVGSFWEWILPFNDCNHELVEAEFLKDFLELTKYNYKNDPIPRPTLLPWEKDIKYCSVCWIQVLFLYQYNRSSLVHYKIKIIS